MEDIENDSNSTYQDYNDARRNSNRYRPMSDYIYNAQQYVDPNGFIYDTYGYPTRLKQAPQNNVDGKNKDLSDTLKTGEVKNAMDKQNIDVIKNADEASDFLEKQHDKIEAEYKKQEEYRKKLICGIVVCGLVGAGSSIAFFAIMDKFRSGAVVAKWITGGIAVLGVAGCVVCILLRNSKEMQQLDKVATNARNNKLNAYDNMITNIGSGTVQHTEAYNVAAGFTTKMTEMQKQISVAKLANVFNDETKPIEGEESNIQYKRHSDLLNNVSINKAKNIVNRVSNGYF